MALDDLPGELQILIYSHLRGTSLKALCVTCKATRVYAETVRYSRFSLEFDNGGGIIEPLHTPIHKYFSLFWTRPELAGYVKHATFFSMLSPRSVEDFRDESTPTNLVPSWTEAVLELGISDAHKQELLELVKKGNVVALVTVLISRFSNLQTLELDVVFARPPSMLSQVIRSGAAGGAGPNSSSFHRLKELHIENDCDWEMITLPLICWIPPHAAGYQATRLSHLTRMTYPHIESSLSLWHAPSLKKVSMILETNGDSHLSELDFSQPKFPNLNKLRLLDWGANQSILARIFSSMPNIQHVDYFRAVNVTDVSSPDQQQDHPIDNEWAKLFGCLEQTAASLESLRISVDLANDPDAPMNSLQMHFSFVRMARGAITPLTAFTNLRRLEVPIFVLLGYFPTPDLNRRGGSSRLSHILPRTLTELCLRDDLGDDIEAGRILRWVSGSFGNTEYPLDEFQNTADCSLCVEEIRRFLEVQDHDLQTLQLKTLRRRQWPNRWVHTLAQACIERKVELIVSARTSSLGPQGYTKLCSTIVVPKAAPEAAEPDVELLMSDNWARDIWKLPNPTMTTEWMGNFNDHVSRW